jgi:hypothetical protein
MAQKLGGKGEKGKDEKGPQDDQDRPKLSGSNRRREPRLPLTFPIEVSGFERCGKYFVERTSCSDVGEASCAFLLRADIDADSVLAIRSFHWQNAGILESRPVLFQVVRLEASPEFQPERDPTQPGPRRQARLVAAVRFDQKTDRWPANH